MYYVFVLFIGCYRANLQNILLLHLSEAAVSDRKSTRLNSSHDA